MAHNPKLNVYILELNPKKDGVETFRDFFHNKLSLNNGSSDDDIFKKYFQEFLNGIGKDDFHIDKKSKKVFGASKVEEGQINYSIKPSIDANIIHGVIDGGKYGILREYAAIDNKDVKQKIAAKNAVLDKFYVLINTPLNSKYGYLLIQSYTEETIQTPLIKFLESFFNQEDTFHNIIITPFVPKKFIDKFLKDAKIRLFNFSTLTGIGKELRDEEIKVEDQTFEVTINIKPKGNIKPDQGIIKGLLNAIGLKKFDDKRLSDLDSKVFMESGEKSRRANFDITKEMASIRPTIYLEDEGIEVNEDTSLPNFNQIEAFCLSLLEEVKEEHTEKIQIDEL